MADIVFVSIIVAFFALALCLVRACERIIGTDEQVLAPKASAHLPEQELAA